MAAAISLRSYLHVQTDKPSLDPTITLRCEDIGLSHSWSIKSLPWPEYTKSDIAQQKDDVPTTIDPILEASLRPFVSSVSSTLSEHECKIHQAAASTFLYLYLLLCTPSMPSHTFTLRSTIPIGAGLGSSASIGVCIATALLLLTPSARLKIPSPGLSSPNQEVLERINAYAFLGECIIHNTPSGVDNTVSTLGKAVLFRRTTGAKPTITSLQKFPELPLLIVDTKQQKSTARQVALVRELKTRHPGVVDSVLDAIDNITVSAAGLIGSYEDDREFLTRMGELVGLNHDLLRTLGVSHAKLELLRDMVESSGVGWFKLTGAGGGGCGFVLLKQNGGQDVEMLEKLEREMEEAGFEKFETTLGGNGVGVLLPTGRETIISQDAFLAAKGRDGLEELMGDAAGHEWLYWNI